MSILSVKDLKVNYGQVKALSGVNLKIDKGEFVGIIGPNGGGKSTFVKTILGLITPKSGEINLQEDSVIGYVPQNKSFDHRFPISVEDVILTGHLPKKMRFLYSFTKEIKNHSKEVMDKLGIYELRKRQIGQLSGGQLQRVLIARALMNHPNILILDEPTAGVDQNSKQEIYNLLKNLKKEITLILISHEIKELPELVDTIIYINQKAHIHKLSKEIKNGKEVCCPIDWFVEGVKIQEELMKVGK